MFITKRWISQSKVIVAAVLLCTLLGMVIYQFRATSPQALGHDAVLQKVLGTVSDSEHDPLQYIKNEVEHEYIKQLWKEIDRVEDAVEQVTHDLANSRANDVIKYIGQEALKGIDGVSAESLRGLKGKENLLAAIESKFDRRAYYDDILEKVIMRNKPTSPDVKQGDKIGGFGLNNVFKPVFLKKFLSDRRVVLTDEQFLDLQTKHDNVVNVLREIPPPPRPFCSGDGIVINGGGDYLLGALTVIGNIRELGLKLPIELVLSYRNEYDLYICEKLLPRFNTKCLVVEDMIGAPLLKKIDLKRFQLKVLGLFVSSFDNIIALDADNFLTKNPDTLLEMDVYKQTNFILWPDLWHKGISPKYYDIARFDIGEPIGRMGIPNDWSYTEYIAKNRDTDILFHDLEGTTPAIGAETGQMVFLKRKHYRSFLLALYYNVFGYSHYYPLLFQGVYGSGDRETFAPALEVMNEPYHQVWRETWLAGFQDSGNAFRETTLVQYDPQQSADFFRYWHDWLALKKLDRRLWPFQANDYTRNLLKEFQTDHKGYRMPQVMFLHIHRPKINAVANALPHGESYDDLFTRRNLGLPGKYPEFGTTDWELRFHSISRWFACKGVDSKGFWRDISKLEQSKVCEAVSKYVEFLLTDSTDPDAEKLKVIPSL